MMSNLQNLHRPYYKRYTYIRGNIVLVRLTFIIFRLFALVFIMTCVEYKIQVNITLVSCTKYTLMNFGTIELTLDIMRNEKLVRFHISIGTSSQSAGIHQSSWWQETGTENISREGWTSLWCSQNFTECYRWVIILCKWINWMYFPFDWNITMAKKEDELTW